jgi:enoyl-CoA hydratase
MSPKVSFTAAVDEGDVSLSIRSGVAYILFNRPAARNAMTWTMYEKFAAVCREIEASKDVRVAVLRGAGGKAFIAGTDISQFQAFTSGEDGLAYEAKIDSFIAALETLRVPSVAVVEGYAVGGGLAIANACDIRIAAEGARFGVPIARTLGNCLSSGNIRRLCATLGIAWVKRMLLLAEMPTAEQLAPLGYVEAVVPAAEVDAAVEHVCAKLLSHAPLTMWAARETMRRLSYNPEAEISDLIRACYGSEDFHNGVAAFGNKKPADWQGR